MGMPSEKAISLVTTNAFQLRNPKFRVPLDSLEEVLIQAKSELNIENIGLEFSYKTRSYNLSQTGSFLALCETISKAAELYIQYAKLGESIGTPTLERRGAKTFIVWNERYTDHERYRHVCEAVFGGYAITVNWLSWSFARGVKSVSFRHGAPTDTSRHEYIFKCPVLFDQKENCIELDVEFADMPLPSAGAEQLIKVQCVLDKAMDNIAHQSAFELETFAVILQAISNGKVSRSIVANEMGLDERTFQRRLKEWGLTYRDVLDNVRQTMCRDYFHKGRAFAEIAQILGFNDQSAFTRAFKKWHGIVPSQYALQILSL